MKGKNVDLPVVLTVVANNEKWDIQLQRKKFDALGYDRAMELLNTIEDFTKSYRDLRFSMNRCERAKENLERVKRGEPRLPISYQPELDREDELPF